MLKLPLSLARYNNVTYICSIQKGIDMETINGITYKVLAEINITGKAAEIQDYYTSMLLLRRPKGHKEFQALRNFEGEIELI